MGDVEPAPGVRVVAERDGQQGARVEGCHERARNAEVPGRAQPLREIHELELERVAPTQARAHEQRQLLGDGEQQIGQLRRERHPLRRRRPFPRRGPHPPPAGVLLGDDEAARLRVVEGADRLEDARDGAIDAEARVGQRGHLPEEREPRPRADLVACPHRGEVPEHEQVERPDDEPARLELRSTLRGERADRGEAHGGRQRHGEAGAEPSPERRAQDHEQVERVGDAARRVARGDDERHPSHVDPRRRGRRDWVVAAREQVRDRGVRHEQHEHRLREWTGRGVAGIGEVDDQRPDRDDDAQRAGQELPALGRGGRSRHHR